VDSPSTHPRRGLETRHAATPSFVLTPSAPRSARDLLAGQAPELIAPQLAECLGPTVVVAGNPCDEIMEIAAARPDLAYLVFAGPGLQGPALRGLAHPRPGLPGLEDPRPGLPGLEDPRIDDVLYAPASRIELEFRASRVFARKRAALPATPAGWPAIDAVALTWNGAPVPLSATEARLLELLLEAHGTVMSRAELAALAGLRVSPRSRTVDTHIYRLRRKLAPVAPVRIETLRQRGFRLAVDLDRAPAPPAPRSSRPLRPPFPAAHMREAAATFDALADPARRRILDLLRAGERSVGDLVDRLALPQPAVSKHLRALRHAGLVEVRRDAQRRWYRLRPQPLAQLDAWLNPYRRLWDPHPWG